VNLIMDSMAALALGTEKPTDDLLFRKPYGRKGKIVTPTMWRNILGQSLIQVAVCFIILYALDYSAPPPYPHLFLPGVTSGQGILTPTAQYTMIFNTFVLMQIFNEVNSRKLGNQLNVFENLHKNYFFAGVMVFTICVQVLIVFVGGVAINVQPLTGLQWLACIVGGATQLVTGLLWRFIPVPLEYWEVINPPKDDLELYGAEGSPSDDDNEIDGTDKQ